MADLMSITLGAVSLALAVLVVILSALEVVPARSRDAHLGVAVALLAVGVLFG